METRCDAVRTTDTERVETQQFRTAEWKPTLVAVFCSIRWAVETQQFRAAEWKLFLAEWFHLPMSRLNTAIPRSGMETLLGIAPSEKMM